MTKLILEDIEEVESNGVHSGEFEISMHYNDGFLVAMVEIELDFDDEDFYVTANVLSVNEYDAMDEPKAVTISNKEIEKFVESDSKIDYFLEDRIQGFAEDSKLEFALSNLESKQWEMYRDLK